MTSITLDSLYITGSTHLFQEISPVKYASEKVSYNNEFSGLNEIQMISSVLESEAKDISNSLAKTKKKYPLMFSDS